MTRRLFLSLHALSSPLLLCDNVIRRFHAFEPLSETSYALISLQHCWTETFYLNITFFCRLCTCMSLTFTGKKITNSFALSWFLSHFACPKLRYLECACFTGTSKNTIGPGNTTGYYFPLDGHSKNVALTAEWFQRTSQSYTSGKLDSTTISSAYWVK